MNFPVKELAEQESTAMWGIVSLALTTLVLFLFAHFWMDGDE